jgi:hypothetical protein
MSIELKIKAKHLALEPAIIRKEESKLKKQFSWFTQKHQITEKDINVICKEHPELQAIVWKHISLSNHRKTVVRNASRATHLARAYIKGTPYSRVEKTRKNEIDFKVVLPEVFRMIAKYGANPLRKFWDYKKQVSVYKEAEEKALWENINKWLET